MTALDIDIAAYNERRADLVAKHNGQWVLFYQGKLIGLFDSLESAAETAVSRFGRGPYLIRQIGAPDFTIPASVMYHFA